MPRRQACLEWLQLCDFSPETFANILLEIVHHQYLSAWNSAGARVFGYRMRGMCSLATTVCGSQSFEARSR
jgi:hypothetical protein